MYFDFKDCRMPENTADLASAYSAAAEAGNLDENHYNMSRRSYFDFGFENSCPILFKISGHDDYSYGKFTIRKPFNFFQNSYSFFYINTNGFISFSYFDPSSILKFPLTSVSVIAPFWSDIDLRFGGNIFHKEINESHIFSSIDADIKKRCPPLNYKFIFNPNFKRSNFFQIVKYDMILKSLKSFIF
jgi:hypothetical protein